jgi:hypothetical protein
MAIELLEEGEGWVKVSKDGKLYTLPRGTFEQLKGQASTGEASISQPADEKLVRGEMNRNPLTSPEDSRIVAHAALPTSMAMPASAGRPVSPQPAPPVGALPEAPPVEKAPAPEAPEEPKVAKPTKVEMPTREGYISGMRSAAEEQKRLTDEKAGILSAQNDEVLKATEESYTSIEEEDKRAKEEMDWATKYTKDKMAERDRLTKEYLDADVDQDRYWSSKSAAAQAGILLATALVDLGKAISGRRRAPGTANPNAGPNPVLAMLKDKIDTDVQIQMNKIGRIGKAADAAGEAANQGMDYQKSAIEKAAAVKAVLTSQLERKATLIGLRSNNATIKNAAAMAANELRQKQLSDEEQQRAVWYAEGQQDYANKTARISAGAAARNARTGERAQDLAEKEFEWRKKKEELAAGKIDPELAIYDPRDPKKVIGVAANKEQKKTVEDGVGAYHSFMRTKQDYVMKAKECGAIRTVGPWKSDCYTTLENYKTLLKRDLARMRDTGVLSNQDVEDAAKNIPQYDRVGYNDVPIDESDTVISNYMNDKVKMALGRTGTPLTQDNDPTLYYPVAANIGSKGPITPSSTAAQLLNTPLPKDGDGLKFTNTYVEWVDGKPVERTEVKDLGEKYLLRESGPRVAIYHYESQARKGDKEAVRFLQNVASQTSNKNSDAAVEALRRLGVPEEDIQSLRRPTQ